MIARERDGWGVHGLYWRGLSQKPHPRMTRSYPFCFVSRIHDIRLYRMVVTCGLWWGSRASSTPLVGTFTIRMNTAVGCLLSRPRENHAHSVIGGLCGLG